MATFLTLFVIPALYAISEDLAWIKKRRARRAATAFTEQAGAAASGG